MKFVKTFVKFINENHTDQIMYVRLVADEPSEIQDYGKLYPPGLHNRKAKIFYLINVKRNI